MGAIAMVIIGAILSLMVAFYLMPDVFGEKALLSRWWWEIVLNLQILCYALMWFCHHNRIVQSAGWWRLRAVSNFMVGMVSVSYPAGILLVSAWMDWFRTPPPEEQVYVIMLAGIGLWAFGAFVMPVLNWAFVRHEQNPRVAMPLGPDPRAWLGAFGPTLVAILVAAFEWWRGGLANFALLPLLMYFQGALPYFQKAKHASPRDSDI